MEKQSLLVFQTIKHSTEWKLIILQYKKLVKCFVCFLKLPSQLASLFPQSVF